MYINEELRNALLIEQLFYHGSKRSELSWGDRNEKTDYNMLGYGIYLTDNKEEAKYYATNYSGKGYLHTYRHLNANILNWFGPVPDWLKSNIIKKDPNFYDLFTKEVEFNHYEIKLGDGCLIEWDELYDDLPDWAVENNIKPGWFLIKSCGNDSEIIHDGLTKEQVINYIQRFPKSSTKTIEVNDLEFYGTSRMDDKLNKTDVFKSVAHLYLYLFTKFKSTKETTNYLVNCGLDGILAKQDTSGDYIRNVEDKPTVMVIYNPDKFKKNKISSVNNKK